MGGIAGAAAALAIPLLPKCPACVLPLVAAAGVALPRGPMVEAAIVGAAAKTLGLSHRDLVRGAEAVGVLQVIVHIV